MRFEMFFDKFTILFILVQLLNVTSATFKYVATVKASPVVAGIVNAINYTISAVVTKFITGFDLSIIIPITFICNLVGVPLGRIILDKIEKEKLWVFNATIRCTEQDIKTIREKLKENHNVHSTYEEIAENLLYSVKIFAYNKNDSRLVKEQLNKLDAKYYIVEPK